MASTDSTVPAASVPAPAPVPEVAPTPAAPAPAPAPAADASASASASSSAPAPASSDVDPQQLKNTIRKQIEFYFGDSNYPKDKFMLSQAALHPEGYIAISVIASFTKMVALTKDVALITEAIKESSHLKVSEDDKMVKRAVPHVPIEKHENDKKVVYAKGFPKEYKLEQAQEFFDKVGKVLSIRFRKWPDHSFKGSMLVEFENEDIARAVLAAPPTLEGSLLNFQTKTAWEQEKHEQNQRKFEYKKGKGKDRKEAGPSGEKDGEEQGEGGDRKRKHEELSFTSGAVVSIKGIGENQNWNDLKTLFNEYGNVAFVDFKKESQDVLVRYKTPEDASKALKELTESKREIGGKVPAVSLLEGEEEKEFWQGVMSSKGGGGRGRGGRGGGRGRGGRGGGRGRGGRGGFKQQRR